MSKSITTKKLTLKAPTKSDLSDTEDDEMIREATQIVSQYIMASPHLLQEHMEIGFDRASRIMDLLEKRGIVGSSNGQPNRPRKVLVSKG